MSQSIAIPRRSTRSRHPAYHQATASASSSPELTSPHASSSSSSHFPQSYNAASMASSAASSPTSMSSTPASKPTAVQADRRPSLLGSSLSHSEYTVINIAGPNGPPRLVTCVKSSQGFTWNQDIFLPSYIDYDSSELERKADPVQDIILTDEEAAALLPT